MSTVYIQITFICWNIVSYLQDIKRDRFAQKLMQSNKLAINSLSQLALSVPVLATPPSVNATTTRFDPNTITIGEKRIFEITPVILHYLFLSTKTPRQLTKHMLQSDHDDKLGGTHGLPDPQGHDRSSNVHSGESECEKILERYTRAHL